VVASALLTFSFTVRAARGSRRAFLRLRLISAIMVVAIVVIIALPGTFPVWMKIEQGGCGLLLLGVVGLVNGGHLRARFTTT
jgi:archaellum biogenesis protein FlaJ (TadC family)